MFGFPASTEFGKRIPKQKFYENIDITPMLKRVFVEQIRLIYWRNKLAATALNLAAFVSTRRSLRKPSFAKWIRKSRTTSFSS